MTVVWVLNASQGVVGGQLAADQAKAKAGHRLVRLAGRDETFRNYDERLVFERREEAAAVWAEAQLRQRACWKAGRPCGRLEAAMQLRDEQREGAS